MQTITTPAEFFGYEPGTEGKLIHWRELSAYYRLLAEQSPRVNLRVMGPTTEENEFLALMISAPDNLRNIERYADISRRLADPRGLSEAEIDGMAREGKALCLITCSIHSHENGGAQMAPLLAYALATASDEATLRALDEVILLLVPCANPDGEILNAQWCAEYAGTRWADTECWLLYHRYAGHGNNRDLLYENLRETRCINDLMHRNFSVQAVLDFHHIPYTYPRMILEPSCDPMNEALSPLLLRELGAYGAEMLCSLEEQNFPDIVSRYDETEDSFCYYGFFGIHHAARLHNIAGILSESAHVPSASSLYLEPDQCAHKGHLPCVDNPHPWQGGKWTLMHIVRQQMAAALALITALAARRERALRDTALKALRQTERGAQSEEQAYLIPVDQRDGSAARRFLQILRTQGIEMHAAAEPVETSNGAVYPVGTVVVPLAQPKMALVDALFRRRPYPDTRYTRRPDGAFIIADTASSNVAEWMGVVAEPSMRPISAPLSAFAPWPEPEYRLPLSGRENAHYRVVNRLLASGRRVCRDAAGTFGESGACIRNARVCLLMGGDTGAYARHTLERFDYPMTLAHGKDICAGALDGMEVLIVPGIESPKLDLDDALREDLAPKARFALGPTGRERVARFVREGGRLIAWDQSCQWAISTLSLPLRDITADLSKAVWRSSKDYCTRGSTLRVRLADDPLTRGCPRRMTIVHDNGPVFEACGDFPTTDALRVVARFEEGPLVSSGVAVGEDMLRGRPCAVRVRCGKGEAILYGFDPQFRSQAEGMYKLLFNALYMERAEDE